MNKVIKVFIIVLGVILLGSLGIYLKLFYLGNNNYNSIVVKNVSYGNNKITINCEYSDTSLAYKDFSYQQVGGEIYVNVNNVLVSKKYNDSKFSLVIPVGISNIDHIHFTDGKTTKVIFSKETN